MLFYKIFRTVLQDETAELFHERIRCNKRDFCRQIFEDKQYMASISAKIWAKNSIQFSSEATFTFPKNRRLCETLEKWENFFCQIYLEDTSVYLEFHADYE